jgi:Tfp pilus assembly protein PilV
VAWLLRVRRALRREAGFGLIELLASMTILNVGLLALVASFSSGQVALRNASRISTASTIAETHVDLFRALTWASIGLKDSGTSSVATVDNTYKCDKVLGTSCPNLTTTLVTRADCAASPPPECMPTQTLTGADGKSYRVDTYITSYTPTNGRAVRRVTVVVRNPSNLSGVPFARAATDFDQSTAS